MTAFFVALSPVIRVVVISGRWWKDRTTQKRRAQAAYEDALNHCCRVWHD